METFRSLELELCVNQDISVHLDHHLLAFIEAELCSAKGLKLSNLLEFSQIFLLPGKTKNLLFQQVGLVYFLMFFPVYSVSSKLVVTISFSLKHKLLAEIVTDKLAHTYPPMV